MKDDEPKASKKWRFKYIVTEVYGEIPKGCEIKIGTLVFDDRYHGRVYDWNMYDLAHRSGPKFLWGFTGTYVEKISIADFEAMPREPAGTPA